MIPARSWFSAILFVSSSLMISGGTMPKPDFIVAADGSGNFKTVQAAVASISTNNTERIVIFIKNGIYREKIRVDAPFVTLRGQSRKSTRIEFPQLNEDFSAKPDDLGRAVINLTESANDFVLQNLTVENTAGIIGPHAFTIYGRGDRTVIVDCDVLSHGADTVALWRNTGGRYYHARCNFRGSVDFMCPRGWCYATDCTFYEMKDTAAVWHDGSRDKDMKFVMNNCKFDGTNGWNLARHHHDAQFYFLNCSFFRTMIDKPPFRVIYPLGTNAPTEADIQRNKDLDASNVWGERSYFYNCHRNGGDYAWHNDNLSSAPGAPKPEQTTAAWTFGKTWNPENKSGPTIRQVKTGNGEIEVAFGECVTVKGKPQLKLRGGGLADYTSGSGTDTLVFTASGGKGPDVVSVKLNGGAIIATEAAVIIRSAELTLKQPGIND